MRILFFIAFSFLIISSCKNENESNLIIKAEKALEANPNEETATVLVKAIIDEYEKVKDQPTKVALLKKGLEVANKYNLKQESSSFKLGIITEDPLSDESGNILLEMAKDLKSRDKLEVADIMFKGIAANFESLTSLAEAEMTDAAINPDTLMLKLSQTIFPKDDPSNINKVAAHQYVDICEAYALANPKSEASVDYLFKGIQMSRSLNSFKKSMSLCDMILKKYPNDKKAASALFVKGFIMENNYKQLDEAKKFYLEFLEKYPNDELADDVATLLNNLGKSDEELFKAIKKQ